MAEPLRLGPFLGANLALDAKLLRPEIGVVSLNQKLGRGDLRPWRIPATVATVPSGRKTIYRFGRDTASDASYWFSWTTIVHAVRAFIADDTTERTYYTGSGAPKVADNTISIATAPFPTAFRDLGVPQPVGKPTLTQVSAGTGDDETRFYLYTFVTDRNEESAPSPVSDPIVCKPGAVINIGNIDAVPSGSHGINRVRIYRTQAATGGAAEFFFLREISAATSTQDDARGLGSDTLRTNGPSGLLGRQWTPPPADLKNLVGMNNGMMAGISGRAVRFCEPYEFHAWPAAYEVLPEDTPVALAFFQSSLLVLTTGTPLLLSGTAPEVMDGPPVEFIAACVSVQSVVNFKHGACWATATGLAYVGSNGPPRILTEGLMLREDWQALAPSTIVAGQYAGRYMGFYNDGAGLKGFMLNPLAPEEGIYFFSTGYSACWFDPLQETFYVLDGTAVKKWDAGNTSMTVTFRSKLFRTPAPTNYAVGEVIASSYPWTFKLWADGNLVHERTVTGSDSFTLPGGFMADRWQIEVSGTGACQGVAIAESVAELSKV